MTFRAWEPRDTPAMARIRSLEWGEVDYWAARITGYLDTRLHPQQALTPRAAFVATEKLEIVGFVAGHLTRRHGCQGELEWINVLTEWCGKNVASPLLRLQASWFVAHGAARVCVDVEPANTKARAFYQRHGATELNKHWLVWEDIGALLNSADRSG